MTKNGIIEKWAKEKKVETLIKKHTDFSNNPYIEDLTQDIYIELALKDNELIEKLENENEIDYFLTKIIRNNLYSKTSPFFYKYQKLRKITDEIDVNVYEKY